MPENQDPEDPKSQVETASKAFELTICYVSAPRSYSMPEYQLLVAPADNMSWWRTQELNTRYIVPAFNGRAPLISPDAVKAFRAGGLFKSF